ncbi:MAG: hypothetical protein HY692_00265, partial [Cyanobacteria bacterium NC_groundwater_1444_Ag_S-0.65um_54_12]|nr:hypothetical protein [Cyanobacteria bacterium NC_groundwater_1444_Ag_S-0.65um_54_12]
MARNCQKFLFLATSVLSLALGLGLPSGCGSGKLPAQLPGQSKLAEFHVANSIADNVTLFKEPEAGSRPILDAINAARSSIKIAMYILSDEQIIQALIAAAKRGVNVQIMLEPAPFNPEDPSKPLPINRNTMKKLIGTGIQAAWSDPRFRFTHAKTMVVDDSVAYILTFNFSQSGTTKNREFGAIDTEPLDVRDLLGIFQADWSHQTYQPLAKRLVVSPDNASAKIYSLLKNAKQSLYVAVEILYDLTIIDLLGQLVQYGKDVKVLMADPSYIPDNLKFAR